MPSREKDRAWDPLLSTVGRVICLGASVIGGQYLITTPGATAATTVVIIALVLATGLVGFTRLLSVHGKSALLVAILLVFGAVGIHERGPRAPTMMALEVAAVLAAVVYGTRGGIAAQVLAALCFLVGGVTARPDTGPILAADLGHPTVVVRMAAGFMVMGGVLIAVVSTALRRLEGSLSRARRAEEAVREADERLRLALDAASVGTWSMDAETGVVDWARNVDRVLGLPRPALPRSREEALAWVHPDDRAAAVAAVAEVSAGRAPEYRTEQRLVAPDGRVTWVETRARIRVAGRSGKRWLTGTLVDVTARKVVEQRRQEAQAVLLALAGSEAVRRADRRAALRELTEAGTRLLDVGRCGIWLLEDGGRALRCLDLFQRGRARHDEGTTIAVGAYPAYFAALAAERVIAADDARADPRTRQMETDYLAAFGITAMLDAPVFLEGRMAGVICHEHVGDEPRVWSADEQTLAGSLADCVARALEALARAEGRARLERAYAELGVLSRRMESAKEEERRRIARELHDELGQTVTAMKINLQLAAGDAAAGDGRWTADMLALADRTIQVVRQLTHTLRPPLLDELGLVPALRAFLEEQERRSTVRCGLEAPDSVAPLPPEIEIAVFRVVQESVTNALRHARARAVQVAVRRTDGRIEIEARDDGAGFDVESVVGRALDGSSLGLVGMRERVRTLGGTFAVSSRPGAGTQITVSLPV